MGPASAAVGTPVRFVLNNEVEPYYAPTQTLGIAAPVNRGKRSDGSGGSSCDWCKR
jgi:hypothetical protein